MAVEETLRELDETPHGVDRLFQERAVEQDNAHFAKVRGKLFVCACVLGAALLLFFYFCTSLSRIRTISVHGCDYLSRDYVLSKSGVEYNDAYYLVFPGSVEKKLESDPMIKEARVSLEQDQMILIEIVEQEPIGYRYNEAPTLLLDNEQDVPFISEYMSILDRVPYIDGFFDEEQTHKLVQALKLVDRDILEDISEVHQYSLSYDEQALEIQMRDGVYVFGSYYSMNMLNEYNDIRERMKDSGQCLYFYDDKNVASARACPWNEVQIEKEYWTDEDGFYITNRWGDRVVKHYYQDDTGGYYLDDSGNWIVIPIDVQGNEIVDSEFVDHYVSGWYSTGSLVIPEAEPTEGEDALESENAASSEEEPE